jgi:PAS domain S-box-containing protein
MPTTTITIRTTYPWKSALATAAAGCAGTLALAPLAHGPYMVTPLSAVSGFGLAALLLGGARLWPGVFIGAVLAGLGLGHAWPAAIALGLGSALEAVVAAALVRTHIGVPRRFRSVRHVLALLGCCALAALINATAMAGTFAAHAYSTMEETLRVWWLWWQSDLLGMTVFCPLILTLSCSPHVRWPTSKKVEIVVYTALLALLCAGMLAADHPSLLHSRFPFAVLPLVMWSAFRFGQRVVTSTVAIAAIATAAGITADAGAGVLPTAYEPQLVMLLFTVVVSMTGLMVSAVVRDRRDAMKELLHERDQLEARVRERTLELARANRALQSDIAARSHAENRLKESENRVRLMIDSVVDYAILMLDTDGRITSWNSGAQRIFGYRPEEIIGEHFSRFYTPGEAGSGNPEDELTVAAAEDRFSEEGWRIRKNGSRFWAGVVLTAIRDDTGSLIGFTKVARDLTERRQYEAQLVEAKAAAEKANEAKSEFLARMSHELRTPLNSLLILARLLADNATANLTPKQVRYAETIYGAGSDLLVLIDDILDLARVESGAVNSVVMAPTSLAEVQDFLESTFRQLAREKGVRLGIERAPGTPQRIETDARRLQQILKNLLSNAFKFTSRGSVTLRIAVEGAARLSFAVTDTGIGIPEDKQEVIFEAFKQADDTTSRQYGGSGLGLAISREFARLLGGEIRVQSRPGEGSTFTLFIPLSGKAGRGHPGAELRSA